jgi:hypothetical protein
MPEIDKLIRFNAFHILLIVMISNIIIKNNYEFILNVAYYVLSMDISCFCFVMLHIVIAYIILTSLKFELGFHVAIKFNL